MAGRSGKRSRINRRYRKRIQDLTTSVSGRINTGPALNLRRALGNKEFCILRNHGLVTVGRSVEESVGWFVMAERVAEVHVIAPNGRPISDEAAALAASTLALDPVGWRMFQWLQRSLFPIDRWSTEQRAGPWT